MMILMNKIAVNALFNSETVEEVAFLDFGCAGGYTGRLSLCQDEAEDWWVIERDSNTGEYTATQFDAEDEARASFDARVDDYKADWNWSNFKLNA